MLNQNNFPIIFLFGLISGFSLMLSGNTLNYWLTQEEIDIKIIGICSLISLPYAINFIWAPVLDIKSLGRLSKILGQRLSWLIPIQVFLIFSVILLSQLNPRVEFYYFAFTGLLISFFSSAQDTILGALRVEIILKETQGPAAGIYSFGYRIGMLFSNSGAIFASKYINWTLIYLSFALILALLSGVLFIKLKDLKVILDKASKEDFAPYKKTKLERFIEGVIKPLGSVQFIITILLFLILYRLSDNFIAQMINPFLQHIGYDEIEVASVGKSFGILGSIIGSLIASFLMKKFTIENSLLIFGGLHALAHSCFIIQELYGKNLYILFVVIGFESITGGMSMAAYIAFIASLCKGRFKATQYSFLSSMMGFSRSILPTISGIIVYNLGWYNFFIFATIAAFPSLLLIRFIRR